MSTATFATRAELEEQQLAELRRLLPDLSANPFWAPRLAAAGLDGGVDSLDAFRSRMPVTTKADLVRDQAQHPPYGTNRSRPLAAYTRLHQTSATTGAPLRWLDTPASWAFLMRGWRAVFEAAGVGPDDRVFVAFSFGPFIGLWLAFEAAQELGALAIPGGALSSEARLRAMIANEATVLCCTPTYALRLVEVAAETGIDLGASRVRRVIVGGEPGGSVPAVRERIESAWPGARLCDHYGMTEVGPVTYACPELHDVVHAEESLYLVEVVEPESGAPLECDGKASGELVLTTLGRADAPVLRYRTGDVVRPLPSGPGEPCACGRVAVAFAGGVIGRADDMVHVRGVNLYPSAVDEVVRRAAGVAEYRVRVRSERGMSEVELEVEPTAAVQGDPAVVVEDLEAAFRRAWGLRIAVRLVAPDSLPRFELKARRWVRG